MIVGLLADVAKQESVLPAAVARALAAIRGIDLVAQEPGRYELEGDKLYYMIQDVALRTLEESRAEAHCSHADIQIPLSGGERYGFSLPQAGLVASEDLLAEKDVAFYPEPTDESFMNIAPGGFVVFLPGELHRPCLATGNTSSIRKAVVKIHASLLGL